MKQDSPKNDAEKEEQELDEIWWVDYVEGELKGDLRRDCRELLEKSAHHQKVVGELQGVRYRIQLEGEQDCPKDPYYYFSLQDKIMGGVDIAIQNKKSSRRFHQS